MIVLVFLLLLIIIVVGFYWLECGKTSKEKVICCPVPTPAPAPTPSPAASELLHVTGSLSSEQILALKTSPVLVAPAIAGKALSFVSGTFQLLAGDIAYNSTNDVIWITADPPNNTAPEAYVYSSVLTQVVDNTGIFVQNPGYSTDMIGLPLYLTTDNVDPTDGNGTATYSIWYVAN